MRGTCLLAFAALLAAWPAPTQRLFDVGPGSRLRFHASDRAVLAGDEDRSDLGCRVEPQSPRLGYDLKYTAGYLVHVPADAVAPGGERLRVLFRVRALDDERLEPLYFRQEFDLGANVAEGGGTAVFPGRYVLGPGRYEIDWLMRNLQGRVCSAHWRARAPTPGHTGRLAAAATPNLIAPYREDTFAEEPPVPRRSGVEGGLRIALLVNLAPLDRTRFKLNAYELDSIMGMLRSLHREPAAGLFSVTAFHAYDRRIVYEAAQQTRLDFAAIGAAIEAAPTGVVGVDALADEEGDRTFLATLLNAALDPGRPRRDAVIFLGPKIDREAHVPEAMIEFHAPPAPLFQIAFHPSPRSYPWPGAIEAALRPLGLTSHTVTRPQDFSRALESLLEAIEAGDRAGGAGPGRL